MTTFTACLKSVGAGVLTLILFAGLGYYVYTSLFVTPAPSKTDELVAVHSVAPAQPNEKVLVTKDRKAS